MLLGREATNAQRAHRAPPIYLRARALWSPGRRLRRLPGRRRDLESPRSRMAAVPFFFFFSGHRQRFLQKYGPCSRRRLAPVARPQDKVVRTSIYARVGVNIELTYGTV